MENKSIVEKENLQNWIDEARRVLIEQGYSELGLRRLSTSLGVTTGYFYRRFSNFEKFLEVFRQYWASEGMTAYISIYKNTSLSPLRQYLSHAKGLIFEDRFDYRFDLAMRHWAGSSKKTNIIVDEIESQRIQLMANSMESMGYCPIEAKIRARISYFHQIGYQAMRINDPLDERLNNLQYYAKMLTGYDVFAGCKSTQDIKQVLLTCVPLFGDDGAAPKA